MIRQDLASMIRHYEAQARKLERIERIIDRKIIRIVKKKIVPEIIPFLPPRYTIPNDDNVSIGSGFFLHIRLYYDGKPIYSRDHSNEMIGEIQEALKPKLEELILKYDLPDIIVSGEADVI